MTQTQIETLYNSDFALWVEDMVNKLKTRDIKNLDWENLIEEIESLGARDKRELESCLTTLFEHLLKRYYVSLPDCYRGWESTIKRTQKELKKLLRDSPSLRNYYLEMFNECYKNAVDNIIDEYDVLFPDNCPFAMDVDSLLTEDFWKL